MDHTTEYYNYLNQNPKFLFQINIINFKVFGLQKQGSRDDIYRMYFQKMAIYAGQCLTAICPIFVSKRYFFNLMYSVQMILLLKIPQQIYLYILQRWTQHPASIGFQLVPTNHKLDKIFPCASSMFTYSLTQCFKCGFNIFIFVSIQHIVQHVYKVNNSQQKKIH